MTKTIHVQAHRGASCERPENTLEAFEAAVEIGSDSIELDVHLSSDGVPFVYHDFTDKSLSFSEIKSLKWKTDRISIPSLEEVFKKLNVLNTESLSWVDIELKREPNSNVPTQEDFVAKVIQVVSRCWNLKKTSFRSFDFKLLREIKKQCSGAKIIALIDEKNSDYAKIISDLKPDWIAPPFKTLSKEKIQIAHGMAVKVMPYTVNEVQDWEKIIAWDIDGITTDNPRALLKHLGRK